RARPWRTRLRTRTGWPSGPIRSRQPPVGAAPRATIRSRRERPRDVAGAAAFGRAGHGDGLSPDHPELKRKPFRGGLFSVFLCLTLGRGQAVVGRVVGVSESDQLGVARVELHDHVAAFGIGWWCFFDRHAGLRSNLLLMYSHS